MIEIVRHSESRIADQIEERLKSISAACNTCVVDRNSEDNSGSSSMRQVDISDLPLIRENRKIIFVSGLSTNQI